MTYWLKKLPANTIVYGPRQKIAKACPCKDCESRHPGCHGECDSYKAWRAVFDEDKQKAEDQLAKDLMVNDFVITNMRKARSRYSKASKEKKERKRG